MSWQDKYLPNTPAPRRSAWIHLPVVAAWLAIAGLGIVWLSKALPQAAMDCAAYCEREIE